MKAVVMEVKDGFAAVLADDGRFLKIKNENYRIGTELTLEEIKAEPAFVGDPSIGKEASGSSRTGSASRRLGRVRRVLAPCAAAAAILLAVFGVQDFCTPYSIVSLDVNPSIEMWANRYDLVLELEAVNSDADALVAKIAEEGYRYQKVDAVVSNALDDIAGAGYAAEDGTTYIVIAANAKDTDHAEALAGRLEAIGKEHQNFSSTVVAADDDLVDRAQNVGTTAGKLYLVDCLRDVQDSGAFDESEWIDRPVRDIVMEIEQGGSRDFDDLPQPDLKEAPEENGSASGEKMPENSPSMNRPERKPERVSQNAVPAEKEDQPQNEAAPEGQPSGENVPPAAGAAPGSDAGQQTPEGSFDGSGSSAPQMNNGSAPQAPAQDAPVPELSAPGSTPPPGETSGGAPLGGSSDEGDSHSGGSEGFHSEGGGGGAHQPRRQ